MEGDVFMYNQKKSTACWQTFVQTGQIQDYLRYKSDAEDRSNPRRRIMDISKNKDFY